jgi:hypothetical protein
MLISSYKKFVFTKIFAQMVNTINEQNTISTVFLDFTDFFFLYRVLCVIILHAMSFRCFYSNTLI